MSVMSPPIELSPASPTTSISSTLWAQPSREWIVPAKPKPGRKPKNLKETNNNTPPTVPGDDLDEDSSGSRRMQNRAAQRAFRERKQTQLAELQARLHSYEQGEVERNVALQSVAKKMKEENEELRKENQILRQKITRLEQQRDEFLDKDKKRAYEDTSASPSDCPSTACCATKRARVDEDEQEVLPPCITPSFSSSSPSMVSSPDDTALAVDNLLSFTTIHETTSTLDDIVEPFNCILCTPDAPCVCREVTLQAATNSNSSLHQFTLQGEDPNQQSIVSSEQSVPPSGVTILDNPPAFPASVPIRRRAGASRANPLFPVTPLATASSSSTSKCSGDPDNCYACADDNFGKAFCLAIGHTLNSTLPCVDCPKRTNQTDGILVGGCCGDVSKCGSCGIAPIISPATSSGGLETIPTDDAWRQLKSHPNVAFADLTLLAEVVARKSKCTGSRVVISPTPGFTTSDHSGNELLSYDESIPAKEEDQSVLLTDPHEHFRKKQMQRELPPQLVPQQVLIECGQRRMREVHADGVREALRLLDQKFAHTR